MSPSLITVFEDRQKKLSLSDSQKEDILSFREIIGKNNVRLGYDGTLQIMHYVGFISKGTTRLQILPKVYEDAMLDGEKEKRESMSVMLNLLRVSEFNKLKLLPDQLSSTSNSDILEIFISLFADMIFLTYSRQMNREYIDILENSQFIKGKIDFTSNLRTNPIRKDQHVIKYQSFEDDNVINNVIKTVCTRLIRITQESENKKNLKKALMLLDDAVEMTLSKEVINSVRFTKLNMPFKPVFEMAKMFFFNNAPEGYYGDETVCSFLLPLNELFEQYLYKVLDCMGEGYSARNDQKKRFIVCEDDKSKVVFPDVIVYFQKKITYIIDAKYKNPKYENGNYTNINRADVYQLFAYARVYGIKKVALIYPQFSNSNPPPKQLFLKDYESDITLTVACLEIKTADVQSGAMYLKSVLGL